jgi:hypothetical protein
MIAAVPAVCSVPTFSNDNSNFFKKPALNQSELAFVFIEIGTLNYPASGAGFEFG